MALSLFNRLLRSKSRPAAKGRPPARLRVEALERREVPAVFSGLVNGQLQVTGNDVGNVITLDHAAGKTIVNGTSFLDTQITNGILIQSGNGVDTVRVLRTVKAVTIDGQNGRDKVVIGIGTNVQEITADVTVTNTRSFSRLVVNDASDLNHHNVTMGIGADGFGFITGLAPAAIRYKANDVIAVIVNGSQGGTAYTVNDTVSNGVFPVTNIFGSNAADTFNVRKTTGRLTVNGGLGNDTINVGSAGNTLDGIQGPLTVNGDFGTDTLNVNDQGSTTPHSYTITPTAVFRNGAATINFTGIEKLKVNKGPQPGAPQATDLALAGPIHAGQLATLSGQLEDPDADVKLTLTVVWGDGSKPQQFHPGLEPFTLKHRFWHAGSYTVRVIWTDSAGQSNSEDLSLTVTKA